MELCPYCGKPVEDAPPNLAVHADCWLEALLKTQTKLEVGNANTNTKIAQEKPIQSL